MPLREGKGVCCLYSTWSLCFSSSCPCFFSREEVLVKHQPFLAKQDKRQERGRLYGPRHPPPETTDTRADVWQGAPAFCLFTRSLSLSLCLSRGLPSEGLPGSGIQLSPSGAMERSVKQRSGICLFLVPLSAAFSIYVSVYILSGPHVSPFLSPLRAVFSVVFQARLFRLQVGKWIEECVPTYVQADAGTAKKRTKKNISSSSLHIIAVDRHRLILLDSSSCSCSDHYACCCPCRKKRPPCVGREREKGVFCERAERGCRETLTGVPRELPHRDLSLSSFSLSPHVRVGPSLFPANVVRCSEAHRGCTC